MTTFPKIISRTKNIIVQIATPYNTGTGFLLKSGNLAITNEHVVRGNRKVVVESPVLKKQMAEVIFCDQKYDIAFLKINQSPANIQAIPLALNNKLDEGAPVIAIGHPFGLNFTATKGIVSQSVHLEDDIPYIQHDAALNPGNSGGPLLNEEGQIAGINTFIVKDGQNIGFSLSSDLIQQVWEEFLAGDMTPGTRCIACSNLVFENAIEEEYCPYCGSAVKLPNRVDDYEPVGICKTIEEMLTELGYQVNLSRVGPNHWHIVKGSAKIHLTYHEKSGLIMGDAYLVQLPKEGIQPIYTFLLHENYHLENLSFSLKGKDVILSLIIYDRYLNQVTGVKLLRYLFDQADHYDNILVEKFGAVWKNDEQSL